MLYKSLILLAIFCSFLNPSLCDVKLIDLTWKFDDTTIYWFGMKTFEFTRVIEEYRGANANQNWYAAKEFCTAEHGGTHIDAPYHFDKDGWKVSDIPLDNLIAPGFVVDISNYTEVTGVNTTLDVYHLKNWVKKHGEIPKNSIMLVKFGWSKFYSNKTLYIGTPENPSFPGISKEAAEWIVNNGNIVGVGLDVPSSDPGKAKEFISHILFSKNKIFILENVKLVDSLPDKGFKIMALPMNIKEGSGGPVRIVAEVPKL